MIDHFIARNEPSWVRLESLSRRARRRRPDLSPDELDEFVRLYQQASTHLAYARTEVRDSALTTRLTRLVAEANGALYGRSGSAAKGLRTFFTVTFPVAVWTSRRFVAASALLLFVPALAMGTWLAVSDQAVETIGDEAAREAYVTEEFEDYYSSAAAAQFSSQVLINNIQVSFIAFAMGVFACIGTAAVLIYNGVNIGLAGGLFHNIGEPAKFWGLILPHGLLELSAVVVAGAAGLRMGWAVIAPGDRTRLTALAEEGRRSVVIALGLVLAFVAAGLIEGFVTPSGLPTALRITIGAVALAVPVIAVVTLGRAGAAAGWTGQLGEREPAPGSQPPDHPVQELTAST